MPKIKTVLHTYDMDVRKQGEEYHQISTRLRATPGRGRWMKAWGPEKHDPAPGPIELETEHLFQNQWNSDKGRVFDWYEDAHPNLNPCVKRGHYLDITQEMIDIRNNTLKCGYTGMQFPASTTPAFNITPETLGSAYLKESDLFLLRLQPVSQEWVGERKPLTPEERDFILPLYIEAQTKSQDAKRKEVRAKVLKDFDEQFARLTTERDGFLWLLDHGIPTENCIYYNHTNTFSFGWRSSFEGAAREKLLELLKPFPFKYEVK